MKSHFFVLFLLSTISFAFAGEETSLDLYTYTTNKCWEKINSSGVDAYLYRCEDGSTSYSQPSATGSYGWEGKCGQTTAANVLHMYCGLVVNTAYTDQWLSDYSPGVRPGTLEYGLNEMFSDSPKNCAFGNWDYYYAEHRWDFLDSLYNNLSEYKAFTRTRSNGQKIDRSPIPVLLSMPGKVLHWVTVVDIEGYNPKDLQSYKKAECKVYANTWGNQYVVPCADFVDMANHNGKASYGMLNNYIRIVFSPIDLTKFPFSRKN